MLVDAALGFINHLLAGEAWARDRLKVFAGKTVRLEQGALCLSLAISSNGLFFVATGKQATEDVSITLPSDAPLRALTDRSSLFTAAKISGSAELAESLGFVFRNLRWDVESDLSLLVGDIAARRLVEGSKQLVKWHVQQTTNLALNVAEYFTEEKPAIARSQNISAFCRDVGDLRDAMDRLENRVASLESRPLKV
jgi:ubiquinone biosynthesis protein UbiJ